MKYSLDHRVWPGAVALVTLTLLTASFYRPLTGVAFLLFTAHFLFFRDPQPSIPAGEAPLSPAEGKVVEISYQTENRYLKDECVKIGICLTVFDAHVNRVPIGGKVDYLEYVPGKFMNALDPKCVAGNESNWVGLKNDSRRVLVRQMAGAVARRIVCDVKLGTPLERGQKFGVICYGSRVEFFAPKNTFQPSIQVGERVKAGQTILGDWLA